MSDDIEVMKTGLSIWKDTVIKMVRTGLITTGKQMATLWTGDLGECMGGHPEKFPEKDRELSVWSAGQARLSCREERDQRALECQRTLARGPVSQRQWAQRPPGQSRDFTFAPFRAQGHPTSSPTKPTCSHTCSRYNILEATTPTGNDPGNEPISPSPAPAEPRR